MNYLTLKSDGEGMKKYLKNYFKISLPLQPVGEAGFAVKLRISFSPNDVIPPRNSRKSTGGKSVWLKSKNKIKYATLKISDSVVFVKCFDCLSVRY